MKLQVFSVKTETRGHMMFNSHVLWEMWISNLWQQEKKTCKQQKWHIPEDL